MGWFPKSESRWLATDPPAWPLALQRLAPAGSANPVPNSLSAYTAMKHTDFSGKATGPAGRGSTQPEPSQINWLWMAGYLMQDCRCLCLNPT